MSIKTATQKEFDKFAQTLTKRSRTPTEDSYGRVEDYEETETQIKGFIDYNPQNQITGDRGGTDQSGNARLWVKEDVTFNLNKDIVIDENGSKWIVLRKFQTIHSPKKENIFNVYDISFSEES